MLDLFLSVSQLDCAEFACSLHMILVKECARKEKEGLESLFFFWKNLVDLLKLPVETAYVDCTAYAPCKQLCVEYTTFARKATYCVRIVRLVRVSDLLHTYTTCAYDVRLCA